MARKKLLSEGEVRQFMKLANLGGLSENYFTHNSLNEEGEEEFGEFALEDEDEVVDLGDEEVEDVEDVEVEEEGELISLDDFMAALEQAVEEVTGQPVEASVEGGDEIEGEIVDVEGEPDFDVDLEDEDPLGSGTSLYEAGWAGPVDTGARNKPRLGGRKTSGGSCKDADGDQGYYNDDGDCIKAAEGGAHGGSEHAFSPEQQAFGPGGLAAESLDPEAIVAEVARRVASRLQADHQKKEISEQLAERIFSRLTAK